MFKEDCTFSIYVAETKEGTHLEVRSVNLEHNYLFTELFRHLPQQSRLAPDLQEKVMVRVERKKTVEMLCSSKTCRL